MFTKAGITILCTTVIFLAQSAAEDPSIDLITSSKPSNHAFIGMSCGSRGNFCLQSSISAELSPTCEITFLYSEHPKLKSQETLNSIAERLAAQSVKFDDVSIFEENCDVEIAQYITPTLKTKVDDPTSRTSYNLIALFLILDDKKIKHMGLARTSDGLDGDMSGSKNIRSKLPLTGKIISHFSAKSYIPIPSSDPIENAQCEAERLQQENPDAPFHLIIDLEKWRALLPEQTSNDQNGHEERILACKSVSKEGPGCLQQ